jgi:hypothetical protein
MGNFLVSSLILLLFSKILHYLYRQYRSKGSICPSCSACPLPNTKHQQPTWVSDYKNQTIRKKASYEST